MCFFPHYNFSNDCSYKNSPFVLINVDSVAKTNRNEIWMLFNASIWPKPNMQNSDYQKAIPLELFRNLIKTLAKTFKLWKILKYRKLEESGTSSKKKFVFTDNLSQSICSEINK